MSFSLLSQITEVCKQEGLDFWQAVQLEDCRERAVSPEESFAEMRQMYLAMKAADEDYDPNLRSASGMAGGDGAKFSAYRMRENRLLGDYLTEVMERALKMAESNACMKRIVAAPTAGSCGVIPAVLLSYASCRSVTEDELVRALYVAAGIGEVIAASASIAGAEGGCQAEIGSASAMAAGALSYLEGGSSVEICHACALALKSLLGLTCDPVAGLVEVPCIKRNASGAVAAVVSSQMALAGIRSAIPPDEVIDSMRRIGHLLPACLRETGQEGLAVTPTGIQIRNQMKGQ